jgi:ribulose-phosphate 3-epimerase
MLALRSAQYPQNNRQGKSVKKLQVLPSLLGADFGRLADEIRRAESSGADALHLDIMDGHFVPNLSFGPDVVALARRTAPDFHRNVHLMMTRPDLYLEKFADAGAQTVQIHVEAECDVAATLERIRALNLRNAIVVNPETPVEKLEPYLDMVDEVLVMTVHPGYGGQKFIAECLAKVSHLRSKRPQLDIMVDGGVNGETAVMAASAGANMLVAGSYLFGSANMKDAIDGMRRA